MINEVRHIVYQVSEVAPYINWPYFDYAWGVGCKGADERKRLREDAKRLLLELDGVYQAHALFGIFNANSDGDDLLLDNGVRIPMLRQQKPSRKGQPNLCLADFIRPLSSGQKDEIGLFATTIDSSLEHDFANSDQDASGSTCLPLGICSS